MAPDKAELRLLDKVIFVAQWLRVVTPETLSWMPWEEPLVDIQAALMALQRRPKVAIPKNECIKLRQRAEELHQRTNESLDQKFIDDFRQLLTDIVKWYRNIHGGTTVVEP